ncbi:hypothetical protein C6P44_000743 [Monosporozyma unispora]|nr:hypothetical protein C6P44_000743 [Kazachstania unispora]
MSFRGGGGNRGGNNSFNIPLGIAYQDILSQSQLHNSEVPKLSLPVNNSIITHRERLVASYCMTHLNDVKDSVFNLGDVPKKGSNLIELDNSNDIERYGDKYLKHKKSLGGVESLEDHPFHKDLFPEELFNVMGFNKKKALHLKRFKTSEITSTNIINANNNGSTGVDGEEIGAGGGDKAGLSMLEKLKELAEEVGEVDDEEDEKANKEAHQKAAMEDIDEDEDFEEDEDDDDDYNAEKYFNDGDDDDDGYGDAGDDDEPAF